MLTLPLLSGLRNSGAPQSSARIVEITRACRFCIRSGMEPTDAYNASDLYIRKMDTLKNIDDIWHIALSLNGQIIGISILSSKVELKTLNSLKVVDAKILKVLLLEHSSE